MKVYFKICQFLLVCAAAAKILSACGKAKYLNSLDPMFGFSFRAILIAVGSIEISVVLFTLVDKNNNRKALSLLWLSLCFLLYRIGLYLIGYQRPCACFGNLTDAIKLDPAIAERMAEGVMCFILFGAVAILALRKGSEN